MVAKKTDKTTGKQTYPVIKEFRKLLQEVARAKMLEMSSRLKTGKISGAVRDEVVANTPITSSSLEGMVYRGEGGLDAWVILYVYLYKLNPKQFMTMLVEIKEVFKSKRKITAGEARWSQLSDQLTEDKRLFWSDIIDVIENAPTEYTITRKTKKKTKKK